MEQNSKSFSYNYSAKQQEEVKRIQEKYAPPAENKLEQLRKLDKSAARPGTIAALAVGIGGALVFGVGMCCVIVWVQFFTPGVIVGLLGLAGMGAAYPLYLSLTKKQRQKLAPQILQLAEELIQ